MAQGHKTWLSELLEKILVELGVTASKQLSVHILVILDGLTVSLNMYDEVTAGQVKASWKYTKHLVQHSMKR